MSNSAIAKQKVFVVDDEKQIADAISFVLRETGFDVETFYDPRSVLQRASDCMPDVLVSDIGMPEMDGITLARVLRRKIPNCKVILMSGNPYWKARGESQSGELDGFPLLLKPFPFRKLLELIKSELS